MPSRKKKTGATRETSNITSATPSFSAVEKPYATLSPDIGVQIPDNVRVKMAEIVGELLKHASDLAFIMVEIDDEKIRKSPLFKKAREIVRAIRKLRDIMPAPKP